MRKLYIDLDKCDRCKECVIKCSYFYRYNNNGITSLRSMATMSLVCRRCDDAPCITSCYRNALKRYDDNIIRRANFLCTSCKACSIACPFGTIFVDYLQFLDARCDYCLNRDEVLCVSTCPYGALELKEDELTEDIDAGIFKISDNFWVHTSKRWFLDDTVLYRKKK